MFLPSRWSLLFFIVSALKNPWIVQDTADTHGWSPWFSCFSFVYALLGHTSL